MTALSVWVLSDGAPGHLSQSRGIVDALAARMDVQVTMVELRVRSSGWKRLGRLLLPWIRHAMPWISRIYQTSIPVGTPSLIVSSGGNTLLANALLARETGAINVYSGTLKGYSPAAYRCVFTVTPLGVANNRVLPLPPVPGELARPLPVAEGERCIAVLVGGDGAGYVFSPADWEQFARALVRLAERHQARLLVTTSRRTGAAAEAVLRAHLPTSLLADAVWWSDAPRKVVRDFLAASCGVVVTEDSLTMVAESIYSGRPVLAVSPAIMSPNANDAAALAAYAERGLLERMDMEQLGQAALPSARPNLPDVPGEIADVLLSLLQGSQP